MLSHLRLFVFCWLDFSCKPFSSIILYIRHLCVFIFMMSWYLKFDIKFMRLLCRTWWLLWAKLRYCLPSEFKEIIDIGIQHVYHTCRKWCVIGSSTQSGFGLQYKQCTFGQFPLLWKIAAESDTWGRFFNFF